MSKKSPLGQKYGELAEKIENISLRERAMLLATLLIGVGFLWLQFAFDPMDSRQKNSVQLSATSDTRILELGAEQAVLMEKIRQDPNIVLRSQQQQLQKEIEEQRALLEEKLEGLIAPSKMADVLKQVMLATGGLRLIQVKNLPVEKYSSSSDAEDDPADEEGSLPLFLHGFELVIEGGYYDLVDSLLKLEALDEGFQWSLLDYQVEKYPVGRAIIRVQTVSLEEQWIGV